MNLLITAGNTLVPIDRVRCLTNIFSGRTGAAIARAAWERGHAVELLTSHPEVVNAPVDARWSMSRYDTFDDLQRLMKERLVEYEWDGVVHCAAVGDYLAGGVYAPRAGTHFRSESGVWECDDDSPPAMVDRSAGKVKSDEPELWLRLVRAPKLVDSIRRDWGFRGLLVKFKLEVGISDERLLEIAERSRLHSAADLMVANTLEGASQWAYLGPLAGQYVRIVRGELADRLVRTLEQHSRKESHG